jgi:hypothetical protein
VRSNVRAPRRHARLAAQITLQEARQEQARPRSRCCRFGSAHLARAASPFVCRRNPRSPTHRFGCEKQAGFTLLSVREEADGQLMVALMDPLAVLQMARNPEVTSVAQEVRAGKTVHVTMADAPVSYPLCKP